MRLARVHQSAAGGVWSDPEGDAAGPLQATLWDTLLPHGLHANCLVTHPAHRYSINRQGRLWTAHPVTCFKH